MAAQGVSQNIRGRRHVETRPDLIIVDDAETRENTQTAEARAKLDEWFNKSASGSPLTLPSPPSGGEGV